MASYPTAVLSLSIMKSLWFYYVLLRTFKATDTWEEWSSLVIIWKYFHKNFYTILSYLLLSWYHCNTYISSVTCSCFFCNLYVILGLVVLTISLNSVQTSVVTPFMQTSNVQCKQTQCCHISDASVLIM